MSGTIILDDQGDLALLVGLSDPSNPSSGYSQRILVSTNILRLASPVWKSMFRASGRYIESDLHSVSLPDDSPTALLIVLRIAHMRYKEVPDELSFNELVELAVVCDKYDTVHVVRPFLPRWAGPWMRVAPGREEWIFIAWTFGFEDVFVEGVKAMVRDVVADEKGNCLYGGQAVEGHFPPGVLDAILAAREEAIKSLINAVTKTLETMHEKNHCHHSRLTCTSAKPSLTDKEMHLHVKEAPKCNALMIGSLVQGLNPFKVYLDDPSKVKISVAEFCYKLKEIQIMAYATEITEFVPNSHTHRLCPGQVDLPGSLDKAMEMAPSGVMECDLNHIQEQAKK
ncbi:hypothetical protein K432DRAFT_377360 [Lepidopterella palustris CBS 459.81]|uniref:BTB domain-containing protein n=1 Tax=Lepidopterella palustris CBS 459.81 TaxID=1314670 RepID=A0A8E2EKJ8_9PEZI|nr:hypothetical protein K432DRAFT_377360 [Lepidopterella palustris CBS 459.81]